MANQFNAYVNVVREEWASVLNFLLAYFKNPLVSMKLLPQWQWPTLFFVQTGLAAISGVLTGLVATSPAKVFVGLFLFPISTGIVLTLATSFFYYTITLFLNSKKDFKAIFTVCLFAAIPIMAMNILAQILSPLILLGNFIAALLAIVGFVEHLQLPKKIIMRIVMSIFVVYSVSWVATQINWTHQQDAKKFKATPESLDILEREVKSTQ